jgi:hypothetical protein
MIGVVKADGDGPSHIHTLPKEMQDDAIRISILSHSRPSYPCRGNPRSGWRQQTNKLTEVIALKSRPPEPRPFLSIKAAEREPCRNTSNSSEQ